MGEITYDLTEYDRDGRLDKVQERDWDAYFEMLDRLDDEKNRISREIIALAWEHGCVMLQSLGGMLKSHRYYIHPSLYEDGRLQFTAWDDYGPIWHGTFDDEHWLHNELPSLLFTCKYAA